jgi:hypothetical protein
VNSTRDAIGADNTAQRPWDSLLVDHEVPGSLVAIGREGRLTRQARGGSVRVDLTTVDETALALVDLAIEHGLDLAVVYPAPAGEVAVLLAAEILIKRFLQGEQTQSVGIVTSDTAHATRTWQELGIAAMGSRVRISEVFPCIRALPDGGSPLGRRPFRGALIGRRFADWPVDIVVMDHLSGPVEGTPSVPTIRIFADPGDPELARLADSGGLVWGWTPAGLVPLVESDPSAPSTIPFSVAKDRLAVMAGRVDITIHVARHAEAEAIVRRLRGHLRTMGDLAGPAPNRAILKGVRVAWHHVSTLTSLPCRPSEFDRFAGLPPFAARATRTFEAEIGAWANTMEGDLREIALVIASDLRDLRNILEDAKPFARELTEVVGQPSDTLIVVRTQTAARAFLSSVGGDPASDRLGRARLVAVGRLHREGTFSHAVVVGTPAPWDWHRLDSGLSPDLHVLVLGDADAHLGVRAIERLHGARARWGGLEVRADTWRALTGSEPPEASDLPEVRPKVSVTGALETPTAIDPFEEFRSLLSAVPLVIGEEGLEESVAEELPGGEWRGAVQAVEVTTDAGVIFLPRDRLVDVRDGDDIVETKAGALRSGSLLLIDRRGGRIGLLEAVADRLKRERPDLLAANLLIGDIRTTIRKAFSASGMSRVELHESLQRLGFEKTYQATRGYVDEGGPLAPRDLVDLQRLNRALQMGLSELRLRETFAGVQRWRAFKRATGRALVAAARGSLLTPEATRVDRETGLSLVDLRELVLEARVLDVRECADVVPLADVGQLHDA